MDLNQIAVFVRVMDAGSFTKAAKFLNQPKSRVSRRIAALEKELGVALLYRSTRQFSPTEAGQSLYEKTREHIYALEGAAGFLTEASNEVAGILRLTAAEDMGSVLLGSLIAEASMIYPKLRVALHLSNDFIDLVKEGLDLAIRIGELEDTTLKARMLGRVAFILVASPEYLRAAKRIKTLSDLCEHPALVFTPGNEREGETSWTLKSTGSKNEETIPLRIHCRSNNPKILLDLALADQGVALIPEFLCLDLIKSGSLKRVLSDYSSIPSPVHFVWPMQKQMSPKIRAFVDLGIKRLSHYFH